MTTNCYSIGNRVAVAHLNYTTGVLSNNLGTVIALSDHGGGVIEVRLDSAISPIHSSWYFTSSKFITKIS